jgi:hypothetical protein
MVDPMKEVFHLPCAFGGVVHFERGFALQHLRRTPKPTRRLILGSEGLLGGSRARTPRCSLIRRAGTSGRLIVPPNITLIPLPAKCPELNPQETSGSSCATTSSRTESSKSFDDIVDHCCDAWNKLIDQPWRIISIGLREWAYAS